MGIYEQAVLQPSKMLVNLGKWLDKAETHASDKSFELEVLLNARLTPGQWPLLRQIQGACDAAKFLAARLAGVDPPKHEDNETTLEELRARLGSVAEYLDAFEASSFDDAAERKIALSFFEGKSMRGEDYMMEFALPNFYFHLTTAYAILRHNGVELGKRDYISSLRLND